MDLSASCSIFPESVEFFVVSLSGMKQFVCKRVAL